MTDRKLRKLRERAHAAGITGNSKMTEHQLLEALSRLGEAGATEHRRPAMSVLRGR
jgi:hypothetical protein